MFRVRKFLSILAPMVILAALAYPCWYGSLYGRREAYKLFERVGIMTPGGALGGQILGHNYQRSPDWAHLVAIGTSGVLAFTPALLAAIGAHRALTRASRRTRCGRCGAVLEKLASAQCPACKEPL